MIYLKEVDREIPAEIDSGTKDWIEKIIANYQKKTGEVFFLFCSDAYLLEINKAYLEHNYYTDIITFDSSETQDIISGELYISLDRIIENSNNYNIAYHTEVLRVMAHGILHLIGFGDKTEAEMTEMRAQEEYCISLHP